MQTINLKQYYPFCKEDIFVEVSDEIVEAFLLDKRAEAARDRKMFRYKAFYSLDCNDGIENAAIGWAQPSPEDYLIEKEELAELEAKAKAGEQISLTDLAAAVKAEEKAPKAKKSRTAKPKKPSIRAQLDAAKKEQSKQTPPREKTKELEV